MAKNHRRLTPKPAISPWIGLAIQGVAIVERLIEWIWRRP